MKKFLVSIAFIAAVCLNLGAQEAFKHLSAGIELGTAGIGAELNLPVVTNHLVLKAGATFPNLSIQSSSPSFNFTSLSKGINDYVALANQYLSKVPGSPLMTSLPDKEKLDVDASVNIVSFKAILEYYPSKKSGFHISAGIYLGNDQFLAANAKAPGLWNVYEGNARIADNHPELVEKIGKFPDFVAEVEGKQYVVTNGNLNLGISFPKVRPYFGIGFGKSVPETRCGFQFDLGTVYLGRPDITSTNRVLSGIAGKVLEVSSPEASKVMDTVAKFTFYPVMNFRFIIRIF
ncbi:MAG: hypothetical protein MJY89_00460 [Bacteroidales bacterium]|nr:hypothetical protein [Bacteroidales bacterium]